MSNKYLSKYSNGKTVSAAQYITELICERIAKKEKKDLHFRFWLSDQWSKQYRNQIGSANKLLKEYEPQFIIRALQSSKGLKIYSLRAPFLIGLIKAEMELQAKKDQNQSEPPVHDRVLLSTGRQELKKKNILDKLMEIDDADNSR